MLQILKKTKNKEKINSDNDKIKGRTTWHMHWNIRNWKTTTTKEDKNPNKETTKKKKRKRKKRVEW